MFDIGWFELALVGVLVLALFGPEELPELLHRGGQLLRRLRSFLAAARREVDSLVQLEEVRRLAELGDASPRLKESASRRSNPTLKAAGALRPRKPASGGGKGRRRGA